MIARHYQFRIVVYIIIIVSLSSSLVYVILQKPSLFIPLVITGALIITVTLLIHYINKSTRDLTHFLLSLKQSAFTESFSSGQRGRNYDELSDTFKEIIAEFSRVSTERDLHYQYLRMVTEDADIGILCFDGEGKTIMANPAAKKLLGLKIIRTLEDLSGIDEKLTETVRYFQKEQRTVIDIQAGSSVAAISVIIKQMKAQGQTFNIILLQNIQRELEAKETEAWHQLTRILSHEIMNSVTPIISLTEAMDKLLRQTDGSLKKLNELDPEATEDIHAGIETIHSRSRGLLKFVAAYKDYAKPIKLYPEKVDLVQLVQRTVNLIKPELDKHQIILEINHIDPEIMGICDVALMEQVMINLIKNAREAVPSNSGRIDVAIAQVQQQGWRIKVSDNGEGIAPDILSKIFIPFFTTKSEGSGIGLSICRQVMKMHNGTIHATTSPNGSTFIIEWFLQLPTN